VKIFLQQKYLRICQRIFSNFFRIFWYNFWFFEKSKSKFQKTLSKNL